MGVRKNQSRLTRSEWRDFIAALEALRAPDAPAPAYGVFVRVHVDAMTTAEGMRWGVHTMLDMGMIGRDFLAWHRQYVVQLERQLERLRPDVTIPYWDWTRDREIPEALSSGALLRRFGVIRGRDFDPSVLPTNRNINTLNANTTFRAFQAELEGLHGLVHNAVGGTMATASSPADPLFWLHHSFVDRLWARWQASPQGAPPPNPNERLLPARAFGSPLFGNRVSTVLDVEALGYEYG